MYLFLKLLCLEWDFSCNVWTDAVYGRPQAWFNAFWETIGSKLPLKLPLLGVLFIAFLLGIGVTFAEPAIGALQAVGSIVDPKQAPYLYTLLSPQRVTYTVLFVGAE